jgi:hypothetical protein
VDTPAERVYLQTLLLTHVEAAAVQVVQAIPVLAPAETAV